MTKYISYKIIDGKNIKGKTLERKLDKEVNKGYAIVHEEYVVPILQSELKQGMYSVCSDEQTKGNKQRKGRV